MTRIVSKTKLLAASLIVALGLVGSPVAVLAHQSGDDTTSSNSGSGSSSSSGSHSDSNNSSSSGENETETEAAENHVSKIHTEANQLLQAKRQEVKEHTTAQKQQACKAHQASFDKRSANYAAAAKRHLAVFDKIFARVQAFQASKQLNVPNYDTLVATAKDKQAAAQTAVDALQTLNVKLDCTQTDPASSVATLKTAVANARTALQEYRKAIKDVTVALKGASTAQAGDDSSSKPTSDTNTTTSTGGNQ